MLRYQALLEKIDAKTAELKAMLPLSAEVMAILDRKFRLEFNYNSSHLEGNTLTYSETELLLIFDQTDGGHLYRDYQEMQAHDVTLLMIREQAADRAQALTVEFIKKLNENLLVKEFWKDAVAADGRTSRKKITPGAYKNKPNSTILNNGEVLHYTLPAEVPAEMSKLVAWFNAHKHTLDPVTLAATLHYRFLRIHPFDDGNGRTARLLMNYAFLWCGLPIVVIRSTEKKDYVAALNRAIAGDINYYIGYIASLLLWSLEISLKAGKGESVEEADDLDKELNLLVRELHQVPDEFDKGKSTPETYEVIVQSIFPLYDALNEKISKLAELFVATKIVIYADGLKYDKTPVRYALDRGRIEDVYHSDKNFRDDITGLTLAIELVALKKVVDAVNLSYLLEVKMSDYHYAVIDGTSKELIIKLPYGRFFLKGQLAEIVKRTMHKVISEIKFLTNLT